MAAGQSNSLVELEKELTCSICTDVLYQPLTLLDCLHTFCGACLKEWFSWQASSATSPNPYTCPSCRASVRGTKPNATVTTLLDMFLQANPSRGKTEQEMEDMRKQYKPGDDVLPKLRRRAGSSDEDDRRLLDEVRELSLREVGVANSSHEGSRDRRRRERIYDSRDGHGRQRRHRDASSSNMGGTYLNYRPESNGANQDSLQSTPQTRHVEHQSSLRSLLSASEIDSQEIQEEITRQIMEEGLLEGIDWSNIDAAQQDEITERIVQAYRRRQEEREQSRQTRRERSPHVSPSQTPQAREEDHTRRRHHPRPESATMQPPHIAGPPVSRPHLIDAANTGHRHRRRSSSQGRSRSASRSETPERLSSERTRPAARSVTDLSDPTASTERRRRVSHGDRRPTDPDRIRRADQSRHGSIPHTDQPTQNVSNAISAESVADSTLHEGPPVTQPTNLARHNAEVTTPLQNMRFANHSSPSLGPRPASSGQVGTGNRPSSSSASTTSRPRLFAEPQVSCNRCGKSHLEYELHYNCPRCNSGRYNLCLSCYRLGKGCLHWYGFGHAAWAKYQRQAPVGGYPPEHEQPHALTGHRYSRPRNAPSHSAAGGSNQLLTGEDPAQRLQSGVFCDVCHAFANPCYWSCDICNDGAWGFCNPCVNQGHHCTHPLLPLFHKPSTPRSHGDAAANHANTNNSRTDAATNLSSSPPKSASLIPNLTTFTLANKPFLPLTFHTNCDICTYPIPPSHTRFHCPRCNAGDYDICTSCYHHLVATGRIAPENGHHGWRRCLRGHRMVVVGFEDRDAGQRRVVTRDLVGGLALRDEDGGDSQAAAPTGANADVGTTPNWSWRDVDGTVRKARAVVGPAMAMAAVRPGAGVFPPDGGIGLRVLALWGFYPAEGAKDELMFPKGAEVREAEDINGDWFWGVYAGAKGLFPGNYVRVL